jgi:hypothetical protein
MSAKADYITALDRPAQESKGKIRTHSGHYVNPLQMRANDIYIQDIAHHLSLVCRYTGACPYHYSVAQHSLYVSHELEHRAVAATATPEGARVMGLAGLLHDASETYLNDIASPVKHSPLMKWYRELDDALGKMIFCVFGLDPDLMVLTKGVDDAMFFAETRTWWQRDYNGPFVNQWAPDYTERKFLARFKDLGGRSII